MQHSSNIYPWQTKQWSQLVKRLQNGNLPHALIFFGQESLGKLSLAFNFAQFLLCENRTDKICGNCRSCKLFKAQSHPDFYFLQPEKSAIIKIEQIRELAVDLNHTSHMHGYKVVLISPADTMNLAASNALLKTLEEPSKNVIFILITSHIFSLVATIRSRCQRILFSLPTQEESKLWLHSKVNSDTNVKLLLNLGDQSPVKALHIVKENALESRNKMIKALQELFSKKLSPLQCSELFLAFDKDVVWSLQCMYSYLMDLLKIRFFVAQDFIVNIDNLSAINEISKLINVERLFMSLQKIIRIKGNAAANLNKQLLLDDLFIELQGCIC